MFLLGHSLPESDFALQFLLGENGDDCEFFVNTDRKLPGRIQKLLKLPAIRRFNAA